MLQILNYLKIFNALPMHFIICVGEIIHILMKWNNHQGIDPFNLKETESLIYRENSSKKRGNRKSFRNEISSKE